MLFWGVYNQSLKRVAKYDFTQKKAAEAKAAELLHRRQVAALRAKVQGRD